MKKSNLNWAIAFRFLRAKNQTQVINILTMLSIVAVGLLIAAFIIIISVFNGFDQHFQASFGGLYPDIAVRDTTGQAYTPSSELIDYLHQNQIKYAQVLETKAFATYRDVQSIVKLRGVSPSYLDIVKLDINSGYDSLTLSTPDHEFCFFSFNTGEALGLSINFDLIPIQIQIPRNTKSTIITDQVSSGYLYPHGAYPIEGSQGEKDMLADYDYIAGLTSQPGMVTELAISTQGQNPKQLIKKISTFAPQYDVLSSDQQNASLYKVINTERYLVYAILIFALLLSSLNIVGVLLMTIIEKRRDIALMKGVGMTQQDVQGIFLRLGVLIGVVGVAAGLIVGLGFALGQQHFGWIYINAENIHEPFPVQVRFLNIVFVIVTGLVISVLASWLPSRYIDPSMQSLRWVD